MISILRSSLPFILKNQPIILPTTSRSYAVGAKVVPAKEDKSHIDEDAEKLCKYVCVNYFLEGEEPGPKIGADSEYPKWLFELDLAPPKALEDMDPEIDGWKFWEEIKKRQLQQYNRHEKLRIKFLHMQESPSLKKLK